MHSAMVSSVEQLVIVTLSQSHKNSPNSTSNSSVAISDVETIPYSFRHPALTVTYVLLNAIILIVGITGNALIVALFWRQKRMRTDTNFFIANLAISDILICCVSPATSINTLLMDKQWTLGIFLCKALPTVLTIAVFSSSFTMTAVALNRFLLARSNRRLTNWQRWVIVASLWVTSVLFSIPIALNLQMFVLNEDVVGAGPGQGQCLEHWGEYDETLRPAFALACFIVQFVLPSCVIVYCYGKLGVWLKLRERMCDAVWLSNHASSSGAQLELTTTDLKCHRHVASIRRKRVTNKMLMAIVVVYCASWLPLNVLNLLLELYTNQVAEWKYLEVTYMFTQILGSASAAINPCIFALLNKDYQRHLKSYVRNSSRTVVNFRLNRLLVSLHPEPRRPTPLPKTLFYHTRRLI